MKYKLSEIGRIVTGKTPSTKNKTSFSEEPDKYLFVTPRDMNGSEKTIKETERYLTDEVTNTFKNLVINDKSICVSCIGTIGKVFMPSGPAITNQQINSITEIKNFVLPDYLYYYLTIHQKDIENLAGGTTMPIVNKTSFEQLEVEIPDLETQKKIVHILSALDLKIELINCENCTIENTLQSHFNNWIDNIKPIATVGLDEIAKYTNGLAMQKFRPGDNDLGLPVVKIKEMNSGISKDTERCTSELKEEYTVFPGDVLFAWSGTLCMKIWDGEVAGLNQHIFKVTSDEYPKWFYYFWTKKHLERFINIAKGKATTMGHIQRKELSLSKVLIPNEHELKKQDGLFKPLLEKIISNNSQRQSLIHLRDTILPKLMSGEINLDKVMTDE